MSLSYEPLWQMLNEMNITKMEFAKMIGMSNATLAKIGKNEPITLTTVDKICNHFNCQIENVVKHIRDIPYSDSSFQLEIGTIVLANDTSKLSSTNEPQKRPYVILDYSYLNLPDPDSSQNDEMPMYLVAPIFTSTNISSPLRVPFEGVEIDGHIVNGVVGFNGLLFMDTGSFRQILGHMPDKYMDKLNQITRMLEDTFYSDKS